MLDRLFKLKSNGTTPGREVQAGFATFAAMAYILAVNPTILMNGFALDPAIGGSPEARAAVQAALVTVTALSAALSTLLMAALTNFPLALAPGMGINAFFAFTICMSMGIPWQEGLGMVFVNGVIFLALSVTGVREKIIGAIPYPLKIAITCGIGLFIAFIGLKNGGVIVDSPATFVTHGNFSSGPVALCLSGILFTAALVAWRVPGAVVLGIVGVTVAGLFVTGPDGTAVTRAPGSIVATPASIEPTLFALSFDFLKSSEAFLKALPVILTLLLVDMFDNIGTLIGVTKRAGLMKADGTLPKAGRALVADSLATMLGSLFGTSTVVSYIESASGVEAGGRTGLTAVTVGALMLLALFFTPLILAVPAVATAPVLVLVGIFMLQTVTEIDMKDFTVAAPAALIIIGIPLMFSIAEGIGFGIVAGAALALLTGRARAFPLVGYGIALVFFLKFFEIFPF